MALDPRLLRSLLPDYLQYGDLPEAPANLPSASGYDPYLADYSQTNSSMPDVPLDAPADLPAIHSRYLRSAPSNPGSTEPSLPPPSTAPSLSPEQRAYEKIAPFANIDKYGELRYPHRTKLQVLGDFGKGILEGGLGGGIRGLTGANRQGELNQRLAKETARQAGVDSFEQAKQDARLKQENINSQVAARQETGRRNLALEAQAKENADLKNARGQRALQIQEDNLAERRRITDMKVGAEKSRNIRHAIDKIYLDLQYLKDDPESAPVERQLRQQLKEYDNELNLAPDLPDAVPTYRRGVPAARQLAGEQGWFNYRPGDKEAAPIMSGGKQVKARVTTRGNSKEAKPMKPKYDRNGDLTHYEDAGKYRHELDSLEVQGDPKMKAEADRQKAKEQADAKLLGGRERR